MGKDTKIKYLKVQDKLYMETDLTVRDAPEDEIFGLNFFKNYKIKLVNESSDAEIVDFEEWKFNNGIHV